MKRDTSAPQGRVDSSKKQKLRKFCQSKDRYGAKTAFNVNAGMQGILIFCDRNKEKQSIRECNAIFHELAGELYPEVNLRGVNSPVESEEEEEEDIEASIAKEIQDIKAKKTKGAHLFSSCKTQVECMSFFRTKEPIEPVSFVHALLSRVKQTGITGTKYVSRLVPLDAICQANIKDIEELAKKMIAPHFHQEDSSSKTIIPKTFAIVFNSRLCTNVKKAETIDTVAKLVGSPHKVNLTAPDLTIIIEAFKSVCGISVVKDFHAYKKYNIQLLGELGRSNIEEATETQDSKAES